MYKNSSHNQAGLKTLSDIGTKGNASKNLDLLLISFYAKYFFVTLFSVLLCISRVHAWFFNSLRKLPRNTLSYGATGHRVQNVYN